MEVSEAVFRKHFWEFPGGLLVRIPGFQCSGPGLNPWAGNKTNKNTSPANEAAFSPRATAGVQWTWETMTASPDLKKS